MPEVTREVARELDRLRTDRVARPLAWFLLLTLLLVGLALRLVNVDAPALDRTAWKEIDYIEVSRAYWLDGATFARPEVRWPASPPRATAMELPLVPFAAAQLHRALGFGVASVRGLPLAAWLLFAGYLFLLARREAGAWSGLAAAAAAVVLPLFHPFGHLLLSDPFVLPCAMAALFHGTRALEARSPLDALAATAAFGLAVALKLEPLYLALPLAWLVWRARPAARGLWPRALLLFAVALVPGALWFLWARQLARESLDVFGIFGGLSGQGHDKFQTWAMLSDPGWWRTMLLERIRSQILGGVAGVALVLAGMWASWSWRPARLLWVYLWTIGIYVLIVAEGHLDAPYRQLSALPPLAFFVGQGALLTVAAATVLLRRLGPRIGTATAGLASLALVLALVLQVPAVLRGRDPGRPDSGSRWRAAEALRRHAGAGARIVTLGEYTIHAGGNDLSPVLYYYAGVQGWSLLPADWSLAHVEALRARGATHLVALDIAREPAMEPFLESLGTRYALLDSVPERRLFDLRSTPGSAVP